MQAKYQYKSVILKQLNSLVLEQQQNYPNSKIEKEMPLNWAIWATVDNWIDFLQNNVIVINPKKVKVKKGKVYYHYNHNFYYRYEDKLHRSNFKQAKQFANSLKLNNNG